VFGHHRGLGNDDQPFGIHMQIDRAVGKGSRYAVAIAFEDDQSWTPVVGQRLRPDKCNLLT
jgi:cell wall assembly regulator SMI1